MIVERSIQLSAVAVARSLDPAAMIAEAIDSARQGVVAMAGVRGHVVADGVQLEITVRASARTTPR